ncbi:MAG: hypothetical protein RL367_1377, partial [Pseudomonadota bacterium]
FRVFLRPLVPGKNFATPMPSRAEHTSNFCRFCSRLGISKGLNGSQKLQPHGKWGRSSFRNPTVRSVSFTLCPGYKRWLLRGMICHDYPLSQLRAAARAAAAFWAVQTDLKLQRTRWPECDPPDSLTQTLSEQRQAVTFHGAVKNAIGNPTRLMIDL